jgi:hypothetical protein
VNQINASLEWRLGSADRVFRARLRRRVTESSQVTVGFFISNARETWDHLRQDQLATTVSNLLFSTVRSREASSPDRIRLVNLLSALFVSRLFLSQFVAHDALIRNTAAPFVRSWLRSWFGFRHAFLAAMFAALILHTFQVVFSGHRDLTLFP